MERHFIVADDRRSASVTVQHLVEGPEGARPNRVHGAVLGVAPDAPREVIEAAGKAMQRKT